MAPGRGDKRALSQTCHRPASAPARGVRGDAALFLRGVAQPIKRLQVRLKAQGHDRERNHEEGQFARLTCQGNCCHVVNSMSVTIQLDLPEALVKEAKANGLLESAPIGDLLVTELRRRKAAAELGKVLDTIRDQPGEPMTMEEIQAEVDAVRAERRAREARR